MFTGEIQRGRSKQPFIIAAVSIVVIAAIILVVPMPHTVESTYVLAPLAFNDVTAPRDGVIAEVAGANGPVARGALIAKYDVSEAEKQVPELEKALAELQKQAEAKPNPKAKAAVAKAEAALKAATAALEKATKAAKGKATPALAAAQKKEAAAKEALEKAKAASPLTGEELTKKTEETKAALEKAKADVAGASILAPTTGVLNVTGLEKGKPVTAGAKVATVADVSKLKARVQVPAGEEVKKGMGVELELGAVKKRVLFDADAKDGVAEAEFDNAKGEYSLDSKGAAHIEGTQRSLLAR